MITQKPPIPPRFCRSCGVSHGRMDGAWRCVDDQPVPAPALGTPRSAGRAPATGVSCSVPGCLNSDALTCEYRDRRGRTCHVAFCVYHGSVIEGVPYCRRHAGTLRAIGPLAADPNGRPDVNDAPRRSSTGSRASSTPTSGPSWRKRRARANPCSRMMPFISRVIPIGTFAGSEAGGSWKTPDSCSRSASTSPRKMTR